MDGACVTGGKRAGGKRAGAVGGWRTWSVMAAAAAMRRRRRRRRPRWRCGGGGGGGGELRGVRIAVQPLGFFLSRVGHRRLGSLGREYMGTPA